MSRVYKNCGRAFVLGITGPPGAGKSTITSGLIGHCRARGLSVVSRGENLPVLFGVVTASDPEQAHARSGGVTNKGAETARAAVEMVSALREAR